jgi:hypothetical protein
MLETSAYKSYSCYTALMEKFLIITWYLTVISHVVLYGCENWSLALREKRSLRVFDNRVLRRLFGPKRDEVTGMWRRLHNKELHVLYTSRSVIRVIKSIRWAGHIARMRVMRGA